MAPEEKQEYPVRCHCGKVKGKFLGSKETLVAWDCNCSDCYMRGNIHVIIPEEDFRLDMKEAELEDATILYEWGTKTAKRPFCKFCGILPWYRPRSNPDGYGITLKCIDFTVTGKPQIEIKPVDGQNWEKAVNDLNLASITKK